MKMKSLVFYHTCLASRVERTPLSIAEMYLKSLGFCYVLSVLQEAEEAAKNHRVISSSTSSYFLSSIQTVENAKNAHA